MTGRIAVVGLGAMGAPMAARLIEAGMDVTAFDVRHERMTELVARGARRADSPADAARDVTTVLVMVADGAQLHAAVLGPEGVSQNLKSGATVIVTSTVGVEAVQELDAILATVGVAVADAAVSGGVQRAQLGQLVIMVGARKDVLDRCRPILEALGTEIVHCGERVGDGQAVKMVNQLLCGVHLAAAAEALAFAAALGLDQRMVWDTVRRGAAASFMLEHRGPQMIMSQDTTEESVLSHFVKDLDLVTDAADSLDFQPLLARQALDVFRRGAEMDDGRDGDSVLLRVFAR